MKTIFFWCMVPVMAIVWGIVLLVNPTVARKIEDWVANHFEEQTTAE